MAGGWIAKSEMEKKNSSGAIRPFTGAGKDEEGHELEGERKL